MPSVHASASAADLSAPLRASAKRSGVAAKKRHAAVADEWFGALTVQCLLNYQKSQVFSDKQLPVVWVDGEVKVLSVGENTTASDIVRRLCRGRVRRARRGGGEHPGRGIRGCGIA